MKRWLPGVATIIVVAFTTLLSSCIKDKVSRTYTLMKPVFELRTTVLKNIRSENPTPVGNIGKLFIKGRYLFVNEPDKGVHIIDNMNPAQPRQVSFIPIPGNIDIAVNGNILYADMYDELVAIDITNPENAKLLKTIRNVFPKRSFEFGPPFDTAYVIVGWQAKDTVVYEVDFPIVAYASAGGQFVAESNSKGNYIPGLAGSTARFSIINNFLYAIAAASSLHAVDISNGADPQLKSTIPFAAVIETLYPFGGHLFIGSQSGMFIYNVSDPSNPREAGSFQHATACDPVITDGEHAFVTLRAGTTCRGTINQLDVLDVTNLSSPALIKSYPLTSPSGLAKDGDLLFVCDGTDGLKIFDAADVRNIKLVRQFDHLEPHDVIAWNNKLIVVAKEGIYQYDYNNFPEVGELSVIRTSVK